MSEMKLSISRQFNLIICRYAAWKCDRAGASFYRRAAYGSAIDAYREALKYDKNRPTTLYNLGLACYHNRLTAEAQEAWRTAIKLIDNKNPYLEEQLRILLRQFG